MPLKPKQKKKPDRPLISPKDKIIDAAIVLAAQQGWAMTSARNIADEASVSLVQFYDCFNHKDDIVASYGRRLDAKVLGAFSDINPETPVRDLIFDILMERFDLATPDRPALKSILETYRTDPKQILTALPLLAGSMIRMLEAAGVDAYGWKGAARVAGLTLIALHVTRTWLDDDSQDLSKTMAALDKALSRVEGLADRFGL